jgi:hypothetical protein
VEPPLDDFFDLARAEFRQCDFDRSPAAELRMWRPQETLRALVILPDPLHERRDPREALGRRAGVNSA